jgi:hypothetical protein
LFQESFEKAFERTTVRCIDMVRHRGDIDKFSVVGLDLVEDADGRCVYPDRNQGIISDI